MISRFSHCANLRESVRAGLDQIQLWQVAAAAIDAMSQYESLVAGHYQVAWLPFDCLDLRFGIERKFAQVLAVFERANLAVRYEGAREEQAHNNDNVGG